MLYRLRLIVTPLTVATVSTGALEVAAGGVAGWQAARLIAVRQNSAILKSFMCFLKWLNDFCDLAFKVREGSVPGCSGHGCRYASAPPPPRTRVDAVACGCGPRTAQTPPPPKKRRPPA